MVRDLISIAQHNIQIYKAQYRIQNMAAAVQSRGLMLMMRGVSLSLLCSASVVMAAVIMQNCPACPAWEVLFCHRKIKSQQHSTSELNGAANFCRLFGFSNYNSAIVTTLLRVFMKYRFSLHCIPLSKRRGFLKLISQLFEQVTGFFKWLFPQD